MENSEIHKNFWQIKSLEQFIYFANSGATIEINNTVTIKNKKIDIVYANYIDFTIERLDEILYAICRQSLEEMIILTQKRFDEAKAIGLAK